MTKQLLIIYSGHDINGSTATLAKLISDGASKYVNVLIKQAKDTTANDINKADGIVLGSGTYNGNPEPDMIEFADNVLLAGKAVDKPVKLDNKFGGVFCTSGGFTSGAQPVLNALARIFMTFGTAFIGGGNWAIGQGICGMVDDSVDPQTQKPKWKWSDKNDKYFIQDAGEYGEKLGAITCFYSDMYDKYVTNKQVNCRKNRHTDSSVDPKGVENYVNFVKNTNTTSKNINYILGIICIILILLIIIILIKKK
jgi:multimeric flavodoxin WrbA